MTSSETTRPKCLHLYPQDPPHCHLHSADPGILSRRTTDHHLASVTQPWNAQRPGHMASGDMKAGGRFDSVYPRVA